MAKFFLYVQVRSVGTAAISKCLSLVFTRGRHYGAEGAIRWALPRISSLLKKKNTRIVKLVTVLQSQFCSIVSGRSVLTWTRHEMPAVTDTAAGNAFYDNGCEDGLRCADSG